MCEFQISVHLNAVEQPEEKNTKVTWMLLCEFQISVRPIADGQQGEKNRKVTWMLLCVNFRFRSASVP